MFLPVKPVCRKADMRKDGTSIIFLQYCLSAGKSILLDSGIAMPPVFREKKKTRISNELPRCFGDPDLLNEQLQKAIRVAEDIVPFAIKKNICRLTFKAELSPNFAITSLKEKAKEIEQPKVNLDVFYQIDDYKYQATISLKFKGRELDAEVFAYGIQRQRSSIEKGVGI